MKIKRSQLRVAGCGLIVSALIGLAWLYSDIAKAETPFSTRQLAHGSHATDMATTGIALTSVSGASEANPLALPAIPIRIWAVEHYEDEPCHDRRNIHGMLSGWSFGAAANNLLVIAGASFAPLGLAVFAPAYVIARDAPCNLEAPTEQQLRLLAEWQRAYIRGDIDSLPLDNPDLAQRYADMFRETVKREVTYSNVGQTDDGLVADFETRWEYPDGRVKEFSGGITFTIQGGVVADAG